MVLIQFWALAYRRFSESAKGDSQGSSFTTPVFPVNCRATGINWAVRPHQFHPWGYRPRPLSLQWRASWTNFLQWDPFSSTLFCLPGRRTQSLRRELEAGGQYTGLLSSKSDAGMCCSGQRILPVDCRRRTRNVRKHTKGKPVDLKSSKWKPLPATRNASNRITADASTTTEGSTGKSFLLDRARLQMLDYIMGTPPPLDQPALVQQKNRRAAISLTTPAA